MAGYVEAAIWAEGIHHGQQLLLKMEGDVAVPEQMLHK